MAMIESGITSKGQTTLPKPVREALGVGAGDRVRYAQPFRRTTTHNPDKQAGSHRLGSLQPTPAPDTHCTARDDGI